MAPLPVIADTYRVALQWVAADGQKAINVIHVRKSGSSATAVATAVNAAAPVHMAYQAPTSVQMNLITVTPLDGTSPSFALTASGAHWVGERTGEFIPGTSIVVGLGTNRRGRSYRGRVYLPFCAEELVTNGAIASADAAVVNTAWAAFGANLLTAGFDWVVASYMHATASTIIITHVLTGCGTQRRRQERVRYP